MKEKIINFILKYFLGFYCSKSEIRSGDVLLIKTNSILSTQSMTEISNNVRKKLDFYGIKNICVFVLEKNIDFKVLRNINND